MKKEDISFKMSDEMYNALKNFIMIKSESLRKGCDEKTNEQLKKYRNKFINEFRKNNVDAIKKYEELKKEE